MTDRVLQGVRVAILVTDGFDQAALTHARETLDAAGAITRIVSPGNSEVRAWNVTAWGMIASPVDLTLGEADAKEFDALLLPHGGLDPDALRIEPKAIAFVRAFFHAGKSVLAICRGAWPVIETVVARGRRMEAAVDRALVTSPSGT